MAFGLSPVIPLQKNDEDGFYVLTKTIAENTKQNLRNLLLTIPGERVMLPSFGAGLIKYLFENNSFSLKSEIFETVSSQVERWMPFVEINDILLQEREDTGSDSDGNILSIQILYSIPSQRVSDIIVVKK